MQTTTTTMNPNLNTQSGVNGSLAAEVEAAKTLPVAPEKKSMMGRIASVSSGIFGKIKSVIPFVNNAEAVSPAPSANTYVPRTAVPKYIPASAPVPAVPNLPNYKPITLAEIAPKSTMIYQPPMAIPRRGEVAVRVATQRSAPDLNKDLFAYLSEKEVDLGAKANDTATRKTQTVNGLTSAKLSVYPAGSMPRARVLPRPETYVDYKFEYQEPVKQHSSASYTAPDLSNVFKRQNVLSKKPVPAATQRKAMTALEDVNNYVAEQDRQYYADLAARRSRGPVKNLSLWATRIKEDVIGAVAPNYVMRKAYQAAQAPAATEQTSVPQTAPVQPVAPARPSFLSRLKAGYENAKSTLFQKARKLVTATAIAGVALGMNASGQGLSQPVGGQKTAVAYAAKGVSKTESKPVYSARVSNPAPAVTPKAVYPAKPAPIAYSTTLSKTVPAVNAPSLNTTVSDSTASIVSAYLPKIGFQNGIYRGYQGPNDGSAPVSRTSLCAR